MPKLKMIWTFVYDWSGVSNVEEHVGSELLNNKRFVMHLLHNNTYNFKVISDELKNDLDVVVKVFKSSAGKMMQIWQRISEHPYFPIQSMQR